MQFGPAFSVSLFSVSATTDSRHSPLAIVQ